MNGVEAVAVLRRSPGRLRVHAPALNHDGGTGLACIAAAVGVRDVRVSERTGNVLIEFDESLISEPSVLALVACGPRAGPPAHRSRRSSVEAQAPVRVGWWRAQRAETIHARPAACVAALIDFERYPEWQTYLTAATVLERDRHGRGIRVTMFAQAADREFQFSATYRYPSPNRVVFEQDDGELDAVQGSWVFRSLRGGSTRATFVLEIKPGWRFNLLLRGPLYEQIRETLLDHLMSELRDRVERGSEKGRRQQSADLPSAGYKPRV